MMKGEKNMKRLKIENNKGFFLNDKMDWVEIDRMTKDDLFFLLTQAINSEFEMDAFDETNLANPAHRIIYEHIYKKFNELLSNKKRFKDESVQLYKDAINKYSTSDNICDL